MRSWMATLFLCVALVFGGVALWMNYSKGIEQIRLDGAAAADRQTGFGDTPAKRAKNPPIPVVVGFGGLFLLMSVITWSTGGSDNPLPPTPTAVPPPSWHPDPFGRAQHRYWDGQQWTGQVSTAGSTWLDPPGQRS